MSDPPVVRFDETRARAIYPRPVVKHAILVPIPLSEDGQEIPTFIRPEWGGVQVFYGSYYGIINAEGAVGYGSARDQWKNMHTRLGPGLWVKTSIPIAYRAEEECRIITLIPSEDGGVREVSYVLQPGDWIVRQPGGEVQHIKAAKFDAIYFSEAEEVEHGLREMTVEQFAEWAVAQAAAGVGL